MFKVILYVVVSLIIIHAIIYYFNIDIFMNPINKKTQNELTKLTGETSESDLTNDTKQINESINELKTLNECINNGKINTPISQD
uniref:Uncharacterized protein n=1 Tax=viral metagenome TaxID=1070528 RepID=A0A6C0EUR1_9ZZZZ